jgi:hypothetical protein
LKNGDCRLQIHGFAIADCRFGLPIADWIVDWPIGLSIGRLPIALPIVE